MVGSPLQWWALPYIVGMKWFIDSWSYFYVIYIYMYKLLSFYYKINIKIHLKKHIH